VSRTHVTELRVRYAETDQMGVVYHANYLAWCEVGRTDWIRAAGMTYRDMERGGVGLAVADLQMRFHGAATYDDVVRVETRARRCARAPSPSSISSCTRSPAPAS
jgi:acyl-CoA thioester hydrolase